jgi:hypothetical protein
MNTAWFSLFDMAVCGIPALAVGTWQLVSVNREIAKDKQAMAAHAAAVSPDDVSPDDARHAIGKH